MNAEVTVGPEARTISLARLSPTDRASKGHNRPSWFKRLLQYALIGALACGSYEFITHFVLQSVEVVGVSMLPTIRDSDFYFVNRWVYLVRRPQPNDVAVIRDPTDSSFAVKRIIAGAGDVVHLKNGRVYVNGRELQEPYLSPGMPTYPYLCVNEALVRCEKDQYFVLGDNRKNSTDSRTYGPVPRQNILGLIVY